MWRKDEGFTLLEVLAALFVWVVIASLLVPGLVRMNQERKGFLLEQDARFILAMSLEEIRREQPINFEGKIIKKRTTYSTHMKEASMSPLLCVAYTDFRNMKQERCVHVFYP
ncbi:hypothetical protein FIU87_14110 [Bacillus sp. THAF10]|uniref:type II secretion system protein n=1 Tax=Bacillus sp. THAF10 TaxID=2587848 RepID=UPI001267B114|nr:type II secretion system protein [Bacillus sp. THAF10]QFT89793.1 hypothetical protein FIU87_14110 [Bacillus sp. THAF10]